MTAVNRNKSLLELSYQSSAANTNDQVLTELGAATTSDTSGLQGQINTNTSDISVNAVDIVSLQSQDVILQENIDANTVLIAEISGGSAGTVITAEGIPVATMELSGGIPTSMVPDASGVYDLGSPELPFRDVYLTDNSIYFGDNKLSVTGDELQFNDAPVGTGGTSGSSTGTNVLGSDSVVDASEMEVTGLNHTDLTVRSSFKADTNNNAILLYLNGDETPTNYYMQRVQGVGAAVTGVPADSPYVGFAYPGRWGSIYLDIKTNADGDTVIDVRGGFSQTDSSMGTRLATIIYIGPADLSTITSIKLASYETPDGLISRNMSFGEMKVVDPYAAGIGNTTVEGDWTTLATIPASVGAFECDTATSVVNYKLLDQYVLISFSYSAQTINSGPVDIATLINQILSDESLTLDIEALAYTADHTQRYAVPIEGLAYADDQSAGTSTQGMRTGMFYVPKLSSGSTLTETFYVVDTQSHERWDNVFPFTWAVGDVFNGQIKVPVIERRLIGGSSGVLSERNNNTASMYVSAASATATITPGTYLNLFANATVADTGSTGSNFTIDNTNKRITYTGTETRTILVSANYSIISSQSNDTVSFKLSKNGTLIDASQCDRKIGTGSDVGNVSQIFSISMSTDDYIEVFCDLTSSGTVTANYANIVLS